MWSRARFHPASHAFEGTQRDAWKWSCVPRPGSPVFPLCWTTPLCILGSGGDGPAPENVEHRTSPGKGAQSHTEASVTEQLLS